METKQRNQIPSQYKWRLDALYPTKESWEADIAAIEEDCEALEEFKDNLAPL